MTTKIYGRAAPVYRQAGWVGVLPLPAGKKATPPEGFTGDGGADPDDDQVAMWCRTDAAGNVGIRMPDGVVGIDVDQYDKVKPDGTVVVKRGGDQLAELEAELGVALPPTWVTSARPAPSGVRWYRVPEGLRFVGELTDSIEILQRHHRYAVAPPSTNPETGGEPYLWITPDLERANRVPTPEELPELPAAWVERLLDRTDRAARRDPIPPRPVPRGGPDRSPAVDRVLDQRRAWTNGARHPQARDLSMRLARLEHLGHPGATEALALVGAEFCAAVDGEHGRRPEKEWTDLVEGARRLAAETVAQTPPYDELVTRRTQPASTSSTTSPGKDEDDVDDQETADLAVMVQRWDLESRMLPDRFWTARPALEHIRAAAHSRIRSADAALHGVLARLSAQTPHTFELPPLAGAVGSLNYFALVIGPSGAGKSSAASLAAELLARPGGLDCPERPLGSGEGLAENYMGTVSEPTADGGKRNVRRQVRHNVMIYGDEGAALTEMMERKGATLPEAIRRAWTGGALGQSNATQDRTRVINAGNYRLGLLIGFQPEVAAKLMEDDIAGTPQRFLFASAVDPNIPDVDQLPDWPGPLPPAAIPVDELNAHQDRTSGYRRHRLAVHDDIVAEVRADAIARARGQHTTGALDSHRPLHLLKTAGLLAILDGRLGIGLEDWELAGIIWDTSCRVRASVLAAVRDAEERAEAKRIERHATREHAAEAARGSARGDVERLARRLAQWIHDEPVDGGRPRGELRKRLASKERPLADAAIGHALGEGWITEDDGRYAAGGSRPA